MTHEIDDSVSRDGFADSLETAHDGNSIYEVFDADQDQLFRLELTGRALAGEFDPELWFGGGMMGKQPFVADHVSALEYSNGIEVEPESEEEVTLLLEEVQDPDGKTNGGLRADDLFCEIIDNPGALEAELEEPDELEMMESGFLHRSLTPGKRGRTERIKLPLFLFSKKRNTH